ncbi:MAG: cytochrome c biogenesis protein CcdA [Candidatus Micrarchaeota archaeon]
MEPSESLKIKIGLVGLFLVLVIVALTSSNANILPLVISTGFLDGIHPCGFAVLLFFIAFLLSIKRSRGEIMLMGGLYIFGVFAAYLLIGLGIIQAITVFPPHFMAKAGSVLLIFIGIVNIFDAFTGKQTLKIPKFSKPFIQKTIENATMPSALIAGFIVGLCAFPCAGGIYVAILGLIATKMATLEGFAYLIIYNVMFVMPLIIMLALSSNENVVEKLEEAERTNRKFFKIVLGILMIALAIFLLFGNLLV